ncbi:MAG: glycoside hydrolase family 2 protein [Planctomycetota bacterium]
MLDSFHSVSGEGSETAALSLGPWDCCAQAPGIVTRPDQLAHANGEWLSAAVPGTVAGTLRASGRWDFQRPTDIDAQDWWYRSTFAISADSNGQPCTLCFDGLATLADIWLNGEHLLSTDNMFRAYELDVTSLLRANNELAIRFRSLSADLQQKRPRPRWKTNLVDHQQLRWHRTTLLGHIPGWSPPVPAIGPWRDIRLERQPVRLSDVQLVAKLDGTTGVVTFRARVHSAMLIDRVSLRVGSHEASIAVQADAEGRMFSGELRISNPPLWWPHTHGDQPLLACDVLAESGPNRHVIGCGKLGFRDLQVETANGFGIVLNGQPIYCRGACWTVTDIFTLNGTEESLRHDLTLARDAGANLLRVGGTMIYESDLFYRLCDELGLLVWQDFMFANMDYPVHDESFANNIAAEATQQLQRLSPHPCVAIYCGNSEIEQQAAMLGMPRELWRNDWFAERLPALCKQHHPTTAYVPSTPSGGVLPFHANSGVCHFYGIGAYLRSPAELRQTNVRFASECLGFANVPEPEMVDTIMAGATPVTHHPRWKQRIPRDTGSAYDFEDVRDHYLQQLYGLAPVPLRTSDMHRYWQLSRVTSGEMMAQAYSEWRSGHSLNQGALVWFFKDLWPAAGWGVVDSSGIPKAAYYFLKRLWRNRQITLTDEGLNGLHLHVTNETSEPLQGFVEVLLLKEPSTVVVRQEAPVELAGRSHQMLNADEIVGGFYDVSYAYRFGPPHHDVVMATLYDADHQVMSEAFHFIRRLEPAVVPTASIEASAEMTSETTCEVTLSCDRFLHGVRLSAKGFLPEDNYFHLAPQRKKVVTFSAIENPPRDFRADVEALNFNASQTIALRKGRT